jgi:transporter family protein
VLLSAVFAALTAIFAKIGVKNVNSDFATFIRTIVVIITLGLILFATGQFQSPRDISGRTYLFVSAVVGPGHRRVVAVLFPRDQAWPGRAGGADRPAVGGAGRLVRRCFPGEKLTMPNWPGVALVAVGAILDAYR